MKVVIALAGAMVGDGLGDGDGEGDGEDVALPPDTGVAVASELVETAVGVAVATTRGTSSSL